MAKAKVSSKAAEKKKERLEMQKKVDARIKFVNAANKQEDPLSALPSFKVIICDRYERAVKSPLL